MQPVIDTIINSLTPAPQPNICGASTGNRGLVVECSPATWAARVRFPADAPQMVGFGGGRGVRELLR